MTHTEQEDQPWDIEIPDHPPRTDSPEYVKSRSRMNEILLTLRNFYYGCGYVDAPALIKAQCHHGGGLWLKDVSGWFLVRNLAGVEWSAQFAGDPAKVDRLRINARRIYAGFPGVADELGITTLLETPITDAAGVAAWTDSICNASVPLPALLHTGVLPHGGGVHHYPTPITDIETFKQDDFQLWVSDSAGHQAAVVPVAPKGSGDGRVQVLWASIGSELHARHMTAASHGQSYILDASHPLARQAFARQTDTRAGD